LRDRGGGGEASPQKRGRLLGLNEMGWGWFPTRVVSRKGVWKKGGQRDSGQKNVRILGGMQRIGGKEPQFKRLKAVDPVGENWYQKDTGSGGPSSKKGKGGAPNP